jgi:transposase
MSLKKNLVIDKTKLTFFFDESRFGTHSKIGHGWFKKGERSTVKIKLGFENFYIYTAIDPITGQSFSLKLPYVNTLCMNVFLTEMSQELGEKEAVVIMDGAGWHKSKDLVTPKNITIKLLPPYCPELNPVERLWLHIKQNTIINKIYENIAALEDVICDFIKNLKTDEIKQICNYGS